MYNRQLESAPWKVTAQQTKDGFWKLAVQWNERPVWNLPHCISLYTTDMDKTKIRHIDVPGYNEVIFAGHIVQGRCTLCTAIGNQVNVQDEYSLSDESIFLARKIFVGEGATAEEAFFVDTCWELCDAQSPEHYAWFAPGYWYGKEKPFFQLNERQEAGDALDCFSAPVILCYDEEREMSTSLTDSSPGRRKTIAEDVLENIPGILISDQLHLPAMGVRTLENGGTGLYYAYPGYTYMEGCGMLYRMLPFQNEMQRTIRLEFHMSKSPNYQIAMQKAWRKIWHDTVHLQFFADPKAVREVLLRYVDASFTCAQGIAKYMKDCTHNKPSSGFLFRNIDLAHLLLDAWCEQGVKSWRENALAVIESQLEKRRLFGDGKFEDVRASIEAINSLLKCWCWAQEAQYDAAHWLDFVIRETEEFVPMKEYFSIPLMVALYRIVKNEKYLRAAVEKAERSWNDLFSKWYFMGGITDCAPRTLDRESATLAVEGYLDLYELSGEACWLERAKFCADYLETMQVIQDIDMAPYGAIGTEHAHRYNHDVVMAAAGNALSPAGLSHITAGGSCGDIYSIYSMPDFYRLYQATNDIHYLEFAKVLQYHTMQYVNMGEKVGGMADIFHGTGKGFINEFIAIGISTGYVTGRGWAHADNIGWCPYVILAAMYRMKCLTGQYTLQIS